MKTWHKAYSIIELMVAVAIIALISSIAIPSYRGYRVRANINNAIYAMKGIMDMAIKYYEAKGTFNPFSNAMLYDGVNLNVNGYAAFNKQNIWSIEFFQPAFWGTTTTNYPNTNVLLVDGPVTNLTAIPGYVAPGPQPYDTGKYSTIAFGIKFKNNVYTIKCGQKSPDSFSIPLSYLPPGCQCSNVRNWVLNDTPC